MQKSDNSWKKSSTYQVTASYIQPLLLWAGAIFICRLVISDRNMNIELDS